MDFITRDFDTDLHLNSIDFNCKVLDLTDPIEDPKLKFDIVTEHYLIHITNQSTTNYFSWLKAIRENYKDFSKKKLYLIMAVGHRNEEYFAWHQHLGLKLIGKEKVWDLYDEDLFSIQNTKIDSIEIHKINNFLIWKYEKPQRDI